MDVLLTYAVIHWIFVLRNLLNLFPQRATALFGMRVIFLT